MPRVPVEVAEARRQRVHELRNQGLTPAQIARVVGLPIASVQNYLKRQPGDPRVVEIEAAIALRTTPEWATCGASDIKSRFGMVVGRATLERRFKQAGVTSTTRSGLNRRRYWMDRKPEVYLDMLQMDTVKLRDDKGVLREYLSVRDVYSGAQVLLPHDATESGMLDNVRRAFAIFGGIPRVVQCDNGTTDFSAPRRNRLRPWHKFAFSYGVQRIQYIPEAEPHRNGSVESFHAWLKAEYDRTYRTGDLDLWIRDTLLLYNFKRALSTTRVTPASRAPAFDLRRQFSDLPFSCDDSRWQSGACCISYIRLALRDRECGATLAVVRNPACVFALPADFEGSYLRIDVYADRGEVWMSKVQEGELDARKVDGRYQAGAIGVQVGSFVSPFQADASVVIPALTDSPADPVRVDTAAVIRRWARVLKQACPTLLPSGYEVRYAESGDWEVWYRGELVWTEQASPEVIEHAREVL